MARKQHSPESIAKVLRQAESGIPIAELARKAGVHENTVHIGAEATSQLRPAARPNRGNAGESCVEHGLHA